MCKENVDYLFNNGYFKDKVSYNRGNYLWSLVEYSGWDVNLISNCYFKCNCWIYMVIRDVLRDVNWRW